MGGLDARSPAMARIFTLVENLRHTEATILITGESGTGKELLRAPDPRPVAAAPGAVRGRELRRAAAGTPRSGDVRPRARRVHRRRARPRRPVRGGVGRHAVPRRSRRPAAAAAGETAARAAGRHVRAAGREPDAGQPRACHRGDPREPDASRARRPVPRGPATTGCGWCRSRSRRCASAAKTSNRWRRSSSHAWARATGARLRFSPDALRVLLEHDWPGNVREMENALEYAVTVCRGQTVLPEDLPGTGIRRAAAPVRGRASARAAPGASAGRRPRMSPELRAALDAHRWRRAEAAKALGISRITLWRRMQAAGLLAVGIIMFHQAETYMKLIMFQSRSCR